MAGIDDGGETPNPEGYCLLFHPDLLRGTSLAKKMKEYTFFSYEVNEALHMSERERQTIFNCFTEIEEELHHRIDKHSRSIITSNIEVLLNHCLRFYAIASVSTTASLPPVRLSTAMSSLASKN